MVAPAALVPLSVRLRQSIRDGASLAQIVRLAERLLDEGGIRNPEPSTRRTSLHVAAYEGRADVVNWLLENEHEDAGISRVRAARSWHDRAAKLTMCWRAGCSRRDLFAYSCFTRAFGRCRTVSFALLVRPSDSASRLACSC